jgi:hypothetical protein
MANSREAEIEKNFRFFKSIVDSLMAEHEGKVALIRDQSIVDVFESHLEAVREGAARFGNLPFSVQRVINRPIDLGFMSHAADNGITV